MRKREGRKMRTERETGNRKQRETGKKKKGKGKEKCDESEGG